MQTYAKTNNTFSDQIVPLFRYQFLRCIAMYVVQVYNVTSSKTLPQWISVKKQKSLRKDEEYRCGMPGHSGSTLVFKACS